MRQASTWRKALFVGAAWLCCRPAMAVPVSAVTPIACPAPSDGAFCGTITVPFDRGNASGGTLAVGFRLYSPSGAPSGTIVARQGGPGPATTAPKFVSRLRAVMAPLAASGWSILFIDQRGRGLSSAINCASVQSGDLSMGSIASCAQSLVDGSGVAGSAAADYSSAAAADDLEAVRTALVASGKIANAPIDLFGQSYAGIDLEAYGARYPASLRSVVGDAPISSRSTFFALNYPGAIAQDIAQSCTLNTGCTPHPDAFPRMVHALQAQPVTGTGSDYTGTPRTVTATDTAVLLSVAGYAQLPGVAQAGEEFLSQGELDAASRAWLAGDQAPLFRLLAEDAYLLVPTGFGAPANFSGGDLLATSCADAASVPWQWSQTLSQREAAYGHALDQLRPDQIGPYSTTAWNAYETFSYFLPICLAWPTPPVPTLPPGSAQTTAPTLALTGSLDISVPSADVRLWASGFPNARLVPLVGRGHISAVRGDVCAQTLIRAFIANPSAPLATACAATPPILPLATPKFPAVAQDATRATIDAGGSDASGPAQRRLATVAVQTALDGLKRFTLSGAAGAGPAFSDVGLRGGTMTGDFTGDNDGSFTVTLTGTKFVGDVAVDGTASWDPVTFALSATLTLSASGGSAIGSVTVSGAWRQPGEAPLQVRGTLSGRSVALLVPAT